jgi:hypothetical protein
MGPEWWWSWPARKAQAQRATARVVGRRFINIDRFAKSVEMLRIASKLQLRKLGLADLKTT